jgi:hypothetical protein
VRNPIPQYHLQNSAPDDFQIQQQRPVQQIILVKLHLHRDRQLIPAVDLRPPRQARRQPMDSLVGPQLDQIILIEQRGRWPTKLISPLTMLISRDSSSRLVLRNTLPILVTYLSGSSSFSSGSERQRRGKRRDLPPLSSRSGARNLVFPLKSGPAKISPYGRDDSGGRSR